MQTKEIANTETTYFHVKELDRIETARYGSRNRLRYFYWAVCKRCGNRVSVLKQYLLGNRNRSCGCLLLRSGAEHKDWKGVGELSSDVYGGFARSAHVRGLTFEVSMDFLWDLFLKQGRRCSVTGLPLTLRDRRKSGNASLDRIDNSIGYQPGNVRWVTVDVNLMKRTLTDAQLLYYCRCIVNEIGGGSLDTSCPPDLDTGPSRRLPKTKGATKRQINAKKKMPPRWWHNQSEPTEI
jgi:hypothetical protein